ncbi:cytochrome p450, partial [Trifolium pratense]
MCRNEDSAMIGRVASLFWCIWNNRNDKIWNDNIQSPSQVGNMAFVVWNEWFTVHQLQRASGVTAIGLCFRDTNGHFVAGLTQWQQPSYSIVEGEALSLLHAMKEAIHRGFERVQFESDSKLLVDAIHSRRRSNSEFSLIVNDIILLMSSS